MIQEADRTWQTALLANMGALLLTVGVVACLILLTGRYVSGPLAKMTKAMRDLANGNANIDTRGVQRVSEIAAMQGVISTYRNALQDRTRLSREADEAGARASAGAAAANALNAELAQVVKAAAVGDFTGRVSVEHADPNLSALAIAFNDLIGNFDRVVTETVGVLAALARTDLTVRMQGDYGGTLAQLKADANAVGDRFTEVVAQLREASRALKTATGEILSGANDLGERTSKQAGGRPDPNAWFFAMPKGSKIISLADHFSVVLQMAGREKDGKGDRFSLYSLRHFYAVLALREGISIYDIARNMGTSVEIIQQYYGRQATPQMMATKLGGKLKPTHNMNTDAE